MTTIRVRGKKAREIIAMGAYGVFHVDGMLFTLSKPDENTIDIEVRED